MRPSGDPRPAPSGQNHPQGATDHSRGSHYKALGPKLSAALRHDIPQIPVVIGPREEPIMT